MLTVSTCLYDNIRFLYNIIVYILLVTRFDSFNGPPVLVINIILPQPEALGFPRGYLPKYYVNDTALQSSNTRILWNIVEWVLGYMLYARLYLLSIVLYVITGWWVVYDLII